jgi:hypothetical protein
MPQPKQGSAAGQHNEFVHNLLEQARTLADEKEALYERIGANRDVLRNIAKTGLLSTEQGEAIADFYPERKRGEKVEPV